MKSKIKYRHLGMHSRNLMFRYCFFHHFCLSCKFICDRQYTALKSLTRRMEFCSFMREYSVDTEMNVMNKGKWWEKRSRKIRNKKSKDRMSARQAKKKMKNKIVLYDFTWQKLSFVEKLLCHWQIEKKCIPILYCVEHGKWRTAWHCNCIRVRSRTRTHIRSQMIVVARRIHSCTFYFLCHSSYFSFFL